MKNTILIIALTFLIVACSSEESNTPQSTFAIHLTASNSNPDVDEPFTVNLSENEEISEAWISTNNFATGSYINFIKTHLRGATFLFLNKKSIPIKSDPNFRMFKSLCSFL